MLVISTPDVMACTIVDGPPTTGSCRTPAAVRSPMTVGWRPTAVGHEPTTVGWLPLRFLCCSVTSDAPHPHPRPPFCQAMPCPMLYWGGGGIRNRRSLERQNVAQLKKRGAPNYAAVLEGPKPCFRGGHRALCPHCAKSALFLTRFRQWPG